MITQEDRDAAFRYMKLICDYRWSHHAILNGGCDNTSVVLAFNAHRIAAEQAVLDRLRRITGDDLADVEDKLLRADPDFTIPPRKDAVRYCAALADILEQKP